MTERHLVGTDRDPVPSVVGLFLALCRVFKTMEPLSFDNPAKKKIYIYIYKERESLHFMVNAAERLN